MNFKEEYEAALETANLRTLQQTRAELVIVEKRVEAAHRRLDEAGEELKNMREAIGGLQASHDKLVERLQAKFRALEGGEEKS